MPTVREILYKMNAGREAVQQQHEQRQAITEDRATPLRDRLQRVIDAMPSDELAKPHPLEYFAERLRGRQRLSPHRGELAGLLRSLGYTQQRRWVSGQPYTMLWYPPKEV